MSSAEIFALLQNISTRLANIEVGLGTSSAAAAAPASAPASAAAAAAASASASAASSDDVPLRVRAFDAYCVSYLQPFVAACNKLGGDVQKGGALIEAAWGEMRAFLLLASKCKEPAQAALPGLLAGVAAKMKEVSAAVQRNEWEKHMKTLSEGAACLNWLMIKPAPRDFIESSIGGSDYWANNIRKEYRTTNPDQMAFCDTFKTLLIELMAYVKEHHTTGVAWNPQGADAASFDASKLSATAPKAAAAAAAVAAVAAPAGKADLFAALNKGGAITSGLKTVTKDMQTWRAEYKGGDAPVPAPAPVPAAARKPAADAVKGPAKFEFQAATSKWCVENQTGASGVLEVKIGDKKETVYIYGCAGATISIVGKVTCRLSVVVFASVAPPP